MSAPKTLTKDDVIHVANLIKIHIPENEIEIYQDKLNTVLENANVLQEVDTKDVKITAQVTGLTNVLREDEPQVSLSQDDALLNAKNKHKGYIAVTKVLTNKN